MSDYGSECNLNSKVTLTYLYEFQAVVEKIKTAAQHWTTSQMTRATLIVAITCVMQNHAACGERYHTLLRNGCPMSCEAHDEIDCQEFQSASFPLLRHGRTKTGNI